jgi:uncharacterized repeat protein (TIGR03803 family)
MRAKLALVSLVALFVGSAYGANPQPTVAFTFACNGKPGVGTGSCPNGGRPGRIIQSSDGNFYGTAQVSMEGSSTPNGGTVFSLTPGGTFKLLHTFAPGANKNYPNGNLPGVLVEGPDGMLYGETLFGGVGGCNGYCGAGVLYRVNKNGSGFQLIHKFCSTANCSDGGNGSLLVGADGNLYGASVTGGTGNCGSYYQGCGTIFRVTPSTGAYQVVVNFDSTTGIFPSGLTLAPNGDLFGTDFGSGVQLFHYTPTTGAFHGVALNFPSPNGLPSRPASNLTLGANGNFYGLYHVYATPGLGLFEVEPDGSHLQFFPLHKELVGNGLLLGTDGNFWSVQYNGGNGYGEILTISPSQGTVIQTLTPFGESPALGVYPESLIQTKDGKLWGSASEGGSVPTGHFGDGTVFSLDLGLAPR